MKKHHENAFESAGAPVLRRGFCRANYKIIVLLLVIVIVTAAGVVYAMRNMGRSLPYEYVMSIGSKGTGDGQFLYVEDFTIDSRGNDDVYVCEIGNNRVQKFDKDGNFICMWGTEGKRRGEFGNLHGIIVDSRANVYVADTANYRIQVFKPRK